MTHSTSNPPADRVSSAGSSNRTFGLVFAAFFVVVGCGPLVRGGALRPWALIVAAVFAAVALTFPDWLTLPNRWWTKLGELLHRITNPIVLSLIYLVGIVPMGLLLRIAGKDTLRLKRQPELPTYWIPRTPPARADARMKNLF